MFNFFYSIYRGPKAPQNPWDSTTLEWTTPVEHLHGNWPGALPEVHRWPYDYSKPGSDVDFIPQNVPLAKGKKNINLINLMKSLLLCDRDFLIFSN